MSYFKWKQYDEAAECYSKIWPILDLSHINILGAGNVLEHHVLDYADCLIALSKPEEACQKMSYINNHITDVDFR
jgi:hypothetical protein